MISYEVFEKIMNEIKKQAELDRQASRALSKLTLSFVGCFNCELMGVTIELLARLFNNAEYEVKEDWINYFMYELDWGEKWEKGSIEDGEGNDVPLKDYSDLYNLLLTDL